jgi:hypothetical protein
MFPQDKQLTKRPLMLYAFQMSQMFTHGLSVIINQTDHG